jgi:lipoprotein NlpD
MHRSLLLGLLAAALLAGCASPRHSAPVEQRAVVVAPELPPPSSAAAPGPATPAPAAVSAPTNGEAAAKPPLPGAENAGKPGYYTVRPGDTVVRIALENGQNWRDIARWNNLENPHVIEVGQVLRVVPPVPVATTQPVTSTARVESRPLEGRPAAAPAATASGAQAPVAPAAVPAAQAPAGVTDPDENVTWSWPAAGPVVTVFDEARNKGLAISGKAGDPVLAAADGRVVYAGSGLRGYGNLVIVKHNNTYLTAYAHNQALLVKDDQVVRRGQKIAEMGSSEADRVQLHFEIRRQGKPVDPARLLPAR